MLEGGRNLLEGGQRGELCGTTGKLAAPDAKLAGGGTCVLRGEYRTNHSPTFRPYAII